MILTDFIVNRIAGNLLGRALGKGTNFFSDKRSENYRGLLVKIIHETVEDYAKKYPIQDSGNLFAFYKSDIIIEALLSWSFFKDSDFDEIKKTFDKNPNILKPSEEELKTFFFIFHQKIKTYPELKSIEIREIFSSEIFNLSSKVEKLAEKIDGHKEEIGPVLKFLTAIPPIYTDEVIGRERDLEEMNTLLEYSDKPILVNGVGGIGKTTITKAFVEMHKDEFDHILWVDASDGFKEGMIRDPALLKNLGLEHLESTDEEYLCKVILNSLQNLEGKNLMIVDDAGVQLGVELDLLPSGEKWRVLVTSRSKIRRFAGYHLGILSRASGQRLFTKYYLGKTEEESLGKLLEYIGYHTLTIELLAKTLESNFELDSVEDLHQYLVEHSMDAEVLSIEVETGHKKESLSATKHLVSAFKLSGLSKEELWMMQQFSVMPAINIEGKELLGLLVEEKVSKAAM